MEMITMNKVVEIKNLVKRYDDNFQLGELSLDIPAGEIIGLIGENGAGKTTLIKSILDILIINKGEIKIFGKNLKNKEINIKEDIGVVLDNSFFPEVLNAKDINSIMQSIYKTWDSKLYYDYLEKFNIPITSSIKKLSKGMKKKLEIATALAHKPKLLILDEPTSGLDPVVRNEVLDIFLKFIADDEHTILFSTHITSDLEHIADEIVFIDNGKVLLNKSKDDILDNYGILKLNEEEFNKIDKNDCITYKKNKYNYEILVSDKEKVGKKYKNMVVDKITLEELMVIMIKGEKTC